ncbi:olfactory receptor 8K3-like [Sarcophilus harrisii]|uniref:olfactory receptor 8K3-like n=1 Tax=Sarcophilus harrisii TaxID=9305 RepID=UPI00062BC434|nr:olfactory receptor 8K3-like [Sarcophilus harrisii]
MEEMDNCNETTSIQVTEFILMGISNHPDLQILLFLVFLIIYIFTALGNLGLIILTKIDSRLKTPMYFFLRNLAFIDLGYSTAIGPKMLVNFVVEKNIISYTGCATQLVIFITLIVSELFMLSVMAYDRYVAICNPLLYMVIMSDRMCYLLVAIPYLHSSFVALLTTIKIFNSSFWKSNTVSHFYCDSLPLLTILCKDAKDVELFILSLSAFNLVFSLWVVLVSYILILMTILRMNSAEGRRKAFSTCGSHLTVVVVFYGTLTFMYLQPKSNHSFDTDKMAAVFYTLIIPMLNPLIYSLRNKEVKDALKRVLEKQCKCLL